MELIHSYTQEKELEARKEVYKNFGIEYGRKYKVLGSGKIIVLELQAQLNKSKGE